MGVEVGAGVGDDVGASVISLHLGCPAALVCPAGHSMHAADALAAALWGKYNPGLHAVQLPLLLPMQPVRACPAGQAPHGMHVEADVALVAELFLYMPSTQ